MRGAASRGGHGGGRGRGRQPVAAMVRPRQQRAAAAGGGQGRRGRRRPGGAAMARRRSPVGAPAAGTVKDGEGRVRFECVDPMVGNSCMNLKHRKLCWEKTSGRCIGFPVTAARRTREPEKESRSPYEKALVTAHGYGP